MSAAQELIHRAQNEAGVPAHKRDKPLDTAFLDFSTLESFCQRHGISPEEVLARFWAVDVDGLPEDKRIVLMREQARMSLEAFKLKASAQKGDKGGSDEPVPLVLTETEAGIL